MITASITIANALPGIVPTLRDYDMGRWPQSKMKMRNGRVQRWGLSSIPTGDKMRLVWENITYAQAESLCIIWDRNYGIYGQVLLPPETLAGTSGGLTTLMATPFAGATWQFTGPPQVKPVKARRCTVEMPIGVRGFVRQDLDVGDGTQSTYDGCNTCADDNDCTLSGGGGGNPQEIAPCISVIDETSPGLSVQTTDWDNFRAAWPIRPFYTLIPSVDISQVIAPTGYDGIRAQVNRDGGNTSLASDWFAICGLSSLSSGQSVFLFVDNSGSMTTATVQASYNLFLSNCAAANLPVLSVTNAAERYIEPFISALVPV